MARSTKSQKQTATVEKWLSYQDYLKLKDLELLYEPINYKDYMVLCDRSTSTIYIIDLSIPKAVFKTKDLRQWEYGLKQDLSLVYQNQPYMDKTEWYGARLVTNLLWYGFQYDWCSSVHYCQ